MQVSTEDVRTKVQRILAEMLGGVMVDSDGDFRIEYESTLGFVRVRDWGDGDTIVSVEALLVRDVPVTPALFEWMARDGADYLFGKPYLWQSTEDASNTLLFQQHLLGNFLDRQELEVAVRCVFNTANDLDDVVRERFGGARAID